MHRRARCCARGAVRRCAGHPLAPIVAAPALEARRSEVSLDKPWVTEPRKPAAVAPSVTSPVAARSSVAPSKSAAPSLIDNAIAAARSWLFGGNTVARVGLLVLFVGVAFLLRYVAERTHVPIEWRLVGVALGALALLVVGWRLRHKRAGYAITLQGGAIGILYLTVFAARCACTTCSLLCRFRVAGALAAFSGVLAIAQNARALAALVRPAVSWRPFWYRPALDASRSVVVLSSAQSRRIGNCVVPRLARVNWIGFAFTFGVLERGSRSAMSTINIRLRRLSDCVLAAVSAGVAAICAATAARKARHFRHHADVRAAAGGFGIQSRLTDGIELALAATVAAAAYLVSSALLNKRRDAS